MSGKNNKRRWEDFLNYLKDTISGQERYTLERDLEADPFYREAMEGIEMVGPDAFEKDMGDLETRLGRRLRRRRRIMFYSAAAAVASLLIVSTVFVKLHDFSPDRSQHEISDHFTPADSSGKLEISEKEDIIHEESTTGKKPDIEYKAEPEARTAAPLAEKQASRSYHQAEKSGKSDQQPLTVVEAEPAAPMNEAAAGQRVIAAETVHEKKSAAPLLTPGQKSISGLVVSSEDSMPIPGATVLLKGTSTGVVTDLNGNFNMTYSGDTSPVLVTSFVGMKSKETELDDQSRITVAMDPDLATLDEVVVIGYSEPVNAEGETGAAAARSMNEIQGIPEYIPPEPVDGYETFKDYIRDNITYPKDTDRSDRVVVVLRFTVRSGGIIDSMEVLRTGGPAFTEEAERLIQEGPAWKPAEKNGEKIDDQVRIRIVFERTSGQD